MAGLFRRLFGGNKTEVASSTPEIVIERAGNTNTIDSIADYFGISIEELRYRMRRLRLYSPDGTLTQEQVNILHEDNIRGDRPSEKPDGNSERKPENILPSKIIRDFSINYGAARSDYSGKWITFSGSFEAFERDGVNFIVKVRPDDADFSGEMLCRFVASAEVKILPLKKGQHIVIAGFVHDVGLNYRSSTIVINNSNIINTVATAQNSQGPKIARNKPVLMLPSEIVRDYELDSQAAKAKYLNQWMMFKARIGSIARDGVNFIVTVTPEDDNYRGVMFCKFVRTAESSLNEVSVGNRIVVAGFPYDVSRDHKLTIANSSIQELLPEPPAGPRTVKISRITSEPDVVLRRSSLPASGSKVRSDSGREYILGAMVGEPGGEGTVYEIENVAGRVAKIYNERNCTTWTREKVKLMVRDRLNYNGIRLPLEVLNTKQGEFTGFIMERAAGRTLGSLFAPKADFEREFPNWKKGEIIRLGISILKRIKYLHDHNVLMGDINSSNIMFKSPDEVYFIDTDSYQYGPYPCRVGMEEYIAPELQGLDLRTTMRTQGNENFAVAALVFMLLMNGKHPYAHQEGSNSAADIKTGIFPYGAGDRTVPGDVRSLQPRGLWRYIWSHLTFALKDAFIDTFRKDGRNNKEDTRFNVGKWLSLMYDYNTALPSMVKTDPMSEEIFPDREKISSHVNYRTCALCGETKPENFFYDETTCRDCHGKIREEIYDSSICVDCGNEFSLTNGEYTYYMSKGLPLPKRCPNCRKERKNAKQ